MAKSIHQEVSIKATPQSVYETLMSSAKFAAMTGGRAASISKEEGGTFSLFGGDIAGRNVELKPNALVVQAWRSNSWPEGVYSICRFELAAEGAGTRLVFDQGGYPDEAHDMLAEGWQQMYWGPLNQPAG